MKNVLISAYACLPDMGSEEGNGWYYSTLVSQQGYRVCCLTRPLSRERIEQRLRAHPLPNLTFSYVAVPRWVDRAGRWGLVGMYFHYIYWQWAAWRQAATLDKEHRFDLVHHVSYTSLQLGSFLYKLGRPFIFGPVGGGQEAPRAMRRYFREHWRNERMRSLVSRLLLRVNPGCYGSVRRAAYVLAWNEDTRRMVNALGRTHNVVKEFGGVGQRFIPPVPVERPPHPTLRLVWVGRLMPRKALELALHGLSQVAPGLPVHLTVVGDGEMGRYVPDYIAQYNLGERVAWVGKVGYDRVKEYYRQADVFLFTSLRDTGPAQLLEAMGYALPVVTLHLHGQAELVDTTTGIRVPVTEPETVAADLARAIEWMYHHKAERLEMGRNAFRFAQHQRWEEKVARLVQQYYPAALAQTARLAVAVGPMFS